MTISVRFSLGESQLPANRVAIPVTKDSSRWINVTGLSSSSSSSFVPKKMEINRLDFTRRPPIYTLTLPSDLGRFGFHTEMHAWKIRVRERRFSRDMSIARTRSADIFRTKLSDATIACTEVVWTQNSTWRMYSTTISIWSFFKHCTKGCFFTSCTIKDDPNVSFSFFLFFKWLFYSKLQSLAFRKRTLVQKLCVETFLIDQHKNKWDCILHSWNRS